MAKEKNEAGTDSVFEVKKIRELIELMQEHELNEVDLKQADQRIRLRRGPEGQPVTYAQPQAPAAPIAAAAPAGGAPAAPAKDDSLTIDSPTIGTFYSRPKPEASDYVKVGDSITEDTIVCIVEAMKMFNEIPAGVSGKIVEVLVKNGDPVDNNKPLFRVAKN